MLIVDGHHLAHRARHACSDLATSMGNLSGTLYGFLRGLCSTANTLHADAKDTVVVWDAGIAEWRRELCPSYKTGRKPEDPTPEQQEEFRAFCHQLDVLQNEALPYLGVHQVRVGGCEADDVISVLSCTLVKVAALPTTVFSGDKDFHQIVAHGVGLFDSKKGLRTSEDLCEQWGVDKVEDILLTRAIWGDDSDNIAGVPGIGQKRAPVCARYWESPEEEIPQKDRKHVLKARQEFREIVERNLKLMRLPCVWDETRYTAVQGKEVFTQALQTPAKDPRQFAKLCNEWEIQALDEVVRW